MKNNPPSPPVNRTGLMHAMLRLAPTDSDLLGDTGELQQTFVDIILTVAQPARICLGRLNYGRMGLAGKYSGGTPQIKINKSSLQFTSVTQYKLT